MGFVAEPTPEMGEYSVEVRRESFYLRGEDAYGKSRADAPRHGITVNPTPGEHGQGTVEILIEDIPKIRAALDQVEAIDHPSRATPSPSLRDAVGAALDALVPRAMVRLKIAAGHPLQEWEEFQHAEIAAEARLATQPTENQEEPA